MCKKLLIGLFSILLPLSFNISFASDPAGLEDLLSGTDDQPLKMFVSQNLESAYEYGKKNISSGNIVVHAKAIKSLTVASEENYVPAQLCLGEFYLGKYINVKPCAQKNLDDAIGWFKLASKNNSPRAQFRLGYLYQQSYLPYNLTQMLYWWKLAADQGDPDALFHLGLVHENPDSHFISKINMNLVEAVSNYGKAARQGHKEAIDKLKPLIDLRDALPF